MKRSKLFDTITKRVDEPRRFIQVLAGPRQTGKTTLVRQVMAECGLPAHYASTEPTLRDRTWIEQEWWVTPQPSWAKPRPFFHGRPPRRNSHYAPDRDAG